MPQPASRNMQQPSMTTFAVENDVSDAIDDGHGTGREPDGAEILGQNLRSRLRRGAIRPTSSSETSSSAMTCELSLSSSSASSPIGVSWKSSPPLRCGSIELTIESADVRHR